MEAEIRELIQKELPRAIAEEPTIRDFVLRTVSEYYTPRSEFDQKFDRVLDELQRDREEQARKWDEQNRKWDEQNRKWEENTQRLDRIEAQNSATLAEIQKANRRYESTIGALGSRWGLYSEASFRNGLKAILEESFGVEVLNLNEYDQDGMVFGRPEQVEIDVIIKNGVTILCEIKSSMSKSDMYIFDRKASFYESRHQRPVTRKIVMSPMVDDRAKPVAEALHIEVYSYADQVEAI
ncbi:MAG: PD-(D/E)XK nuclease family protein [Snowella sp.]